MLITKPILFSTPSSIFTQLDQLAHPHMQARV